MTSTWRAVTDPDVGFAYDVTPMLVGNLGDLVFDGQSAITQRGGAAGRAATTSGTARGPRARTVRTWSARRARKREFLAIAPWVVPDAPRDDLRAVTDRLAPGSGDAIEGEYVETALAADLPLPVDRARRGCAR